MSKRKWNHPEVPAEDLGNKVWRSAGELEDTPGLRQWVDREFPRAAEMMRDEDDQETTRRSFLKLMGASTALAGFGLAACRRPEALIVPYINSVEWQIPGKPSYYATAMPSANGAVALTGTYYEGRPTKLEPNKLAGTAGVGAMAQASILDLYDPARSRNFLAKGKSISKAEAMKSLGKFTETGKIGFVFGEDDSLTRTEMISQLRTKYASARFYAYEALVGAGRKASAAEIFGKHTVVKADFSKANRILALDCDFLELDKQGDTKSFYDKRRPEGANYEEDPIAYASQLNRVYAVEPTYTVTGGMADHRAPLAPSQTAAFIQDLAAAIGGGAGSNFSGEKAKWIQACAKDLQSGGGVVLLGSRYSKELHDAVYAINNQLGAFQDGVLVARTERKHEQLGTIEELASDIASLDTVILMTPANPVYENPTIDGKKFTEIVKGKNVVQWGIHLNASANAADLHIPAAHYLESWSDGFSGNEGRYTLVQPMILPLYGGIQEFELLAGLLADKLELHNSLADDAAISPAYAAVKATFEKSVKTSSDAFTKKTDFKNLARTGFTEDFKYATAGNGGGGGNAAGLQILAKPASASKPDIVFVTDYSVYDGRYINNSWLQEAPDPMSKLTWDNAAYMSPQTAKNLGLYDDIVELEKMEKAWWANLGIATETGVKTTSVSQDGEGPSLFGPMVKVSVGGKSVEAVVIVAFGMADNVISLPLGYGQGHDENWVDNFDGDSIEYEKNSKNVSSVGLNTGFDAYPLRNGQDYFAAGADVTVERVEGKRYKLARTQEHHSMYGRALAREVSTLPVTKTGGHKHDYAKQLENVAKQGLDSHVPQNISLYKFEGRDGKPHLWDQSHQWAMSIDLSTCTGCNACLVACQAENNIPVVGKTQVAMGREMHWIRMDRYFAEPGHAEHKDDKHLGDAPSNPSEDWNTPLEVIPNPVACVQCESAPCETVCPVNATVHTEDGLNSMAYNRCIGTRYCANNCPYKARRFNFFDYNKRNPLLHKNLYKGPLGEKQVGDSKSLQRNPNVSVRMRGVMEKCTYCVQRLQAAKIDAKANVKKAVQKSGKPSYEFNADGKQNMNEMLMAPANSVTVACQDACEAGSIVFGNILNPKDNIQKTKAIKETKIEDNIQGTYANPRTYDLLNYIGTRPRTSYMARVKNPNPEMEASKKVGRATIHMH